MSNPRNRRIYFVDKKVQGALLVRAVRYWLLSVVVVGTLIILGWMFITPGMVVLVQLRQQLPLFFGGLLVSLLASLAVLPLILYDMMRMSNRFVGPMYRLRKAMQQAADGQSVEPLAFCDQDYWQEFAEASNLMNEQLQSLEK